MSCRVTALCSLGVLGANPPAPFLGFMLSLPKALAEQQHKVMNVLLGCLPKEMRLGTQCHV